MLGRFLIEKKSVLKERGCIVKTPQEDEMDIKKNIEGREENERRIKLSFTKVHKNKKKYDRKRKHSKPSSD